MVSAVTSTRVSSTLNFTDSPTPRRLIRASSTMNPSAIRVIVAGARRAVDPAVGLESAGEVLGQHVGRGRRARDAGADHREGDEERDEVHAERLVRVERRAGRLWVLGDQLEVGQRRQGGDDEGDQERQPDDAADDAGHLAGHGVDARTEDVADDEQQQELGTHHPLEVGLGSVDVDGLAGGRGHLGPPGPGDMARSTHTPSDASICGAGISRRRPRPRRTPPG